MPRTAKFRTTLAALALAATALVGCTATTTPSAADPSPTPTPTPTVSATPEPASAETTAAQDKVTCAAFGDVQDIVGNAYVAFHEDRMGQQERSGWIALASRVLANVPSADDGPVAEALAALKEAVPPVQGVDSSNIISDEAILVARDVFEACEAAGFELYLNGFTGG